MENQLNRAYEAYWWLNDNHPWTIRNLSIEMMKVNPKDSRVSNNERKNTRIDYWLESGAFSKKDNCWFHDHDLDCGGKSFEEAIVKLSKLVKKHYGKRTNIYGKKF